MSKEAIAYLKLIHGAFNASVMLLFIYQGALGFKIRKSDVRPILVVKRHRKIGPVAAVLGITGFIAGVTVVFLDTGRVFKYPLHFIAGLTIASLITGTYLISRRIKGSDSFWRNIHYAVGILIICLYCIQAVLGLGVLL